MVEILCGRGLHSNTIKQNKIKEGMCKTGFLDYYEINGFIPFEKAPPGL